MLPDEQFFSVLPQYELDTFLLTVTEAMDLAGDGQVRKGFHCLCAGLERAREAQADEKEWAPELVRCYQESLSRYMEQFGERLLRITRQRAEQKRRDGLTLDEALQEAGLMPDGSRMALSYGTTSDSHLTSRSLFVAVQHPDGRRCVVERRGDGTCRDVLGVASNLDWLPCRTADDEGAGPYAA